MQTSFAQHFALFVVGSLLLFLANGIPVGFDLDRQGVTIWFVYPVMIWFFALIGHGVFFGFRRQRWSDAEVRVILSTPVALVGPEALRLDAVAMEARALAEVWKDETLSAAATSVVAEAVAGAQQLAERLQHLRHNGDGSLEQIALSEGIEDTLDELVESLRETRHKAVGLQVAGADVNAQKASLRTLRQHVQLAREQQNRIDSAIG